MSGTTSFGQIRPKWRCLAIRYTTTLEKTKDTTSAPHTNCGGGVITGVAGTGAEQLAIGFFGLKAFITNKLVHSDTSSRRQPQTQTKNNLHTEYLTSNSYFWLLPYSQIFDLVDLYSRC